MEDKKEEKKEKKNFFDAFAGFSAKKYWRIQLSLLILFLLGFGFLAYFLLGSQAHKLIGSGERYEEMTSNSFGGKRNSFIKRITSFFTSDERRLSEMEKKAGDGFSFNDSSIAQAGSMSGEGSAASSGKSPAGAYSSASPYQSNQTTASSLLSGGRLDSKMNGSAALSSSEGKSKTEMSDFSGDDRSPGARISRNAESSFKAGSAKGGRTSALDAMKGAWKASLYGARLTSQDAAKAWTAKAFDASPDAEYSIQYDEKVKAKLDRLNPNAIPQFLKDQDIGMDPVNNTLKDSEVPSFEVDKDKEQQKKEDEKKASDDLMKSMMSGMMNSMYGGWNSNNGSDANSPTDTGTDRSTLSDPNSKPDLGSGVTTDEFGNIRVTNSDGTTQIFDSSTGKILGCESATMCILPGGDGCSDNVYFA